MTYLNINGRNIGASLAAGAIEGSMLRVTLKDSDILAPIYQDENLTLLTENPAKADLNGIFDDLYLLPGTYSITLLSHLGETLAEQGDVSFRNTNDRRQSWHFETVSDVIEDTTLSYTLPQSIRRVLPGDWIYISRDGCSFCVAEEASTDHHVTTAGGIKLIAQPDTNGSVSLLQFNGDLNAALLSGHAVTVPTGTFTGDDVTIKQPVRMTLSLGANIEHHLTIAGEYACKTASVSLTLDWAQAPAGTSTFSGNFSGFASGDICMIELAGNGGYSAGNQTGVDFLTVQSANSTSITFTTGTRFPYKDPIISRITNAGQHIGTVARNTRQVSGDYTALFNSGDVIRIENTTETDGVEGSTAYFELCRISTIDATGIQFEEHVNHTYGNPWLVKADVVEGVKITGPGRIHKLTIKNATDVYCEQVEIDRLITSFCYRGRLTGSYRAGIGEPSTSNLTFSTGFSVSDIYCGGSLSSTDNAAFKVLGCPNLQLVNVQGSNNTATAQGNYGIFVDYFFTPYKVWNHNLQAVNLRAAKPLGGSLRASWFTGVRNSAIEVGGGRIFAQKIVDSHMRANCPSDQIEIEDCVRSTVTGEARYGNLLGSKDCLVELRLRSPSGANANRAFWARAGSIDPETGDPYVEGMTNRLAIQGLSRNATDVTLYVQQQKDITIASGCADNNGLTASVIIGSGTDGLRMEAHSLRNQITTSTKWSSARVKGYPHFDGDYRDGGFRMNNTWFFCDDQGLRYSSTVPSATTSGFPLIRQVAVPASATANGTEGDFAMGAGFLYVCVASGQWQRIAMSSW